MPTVVELKKIAKSRGLTGYSKMNKKQLWALVNKPPIKPRRVKPIPPTRTTSRRAEYLTPQGKPKLFWYYRVEEEYPLTNQTKVVDINGDYGESVTLNEFINNAFREGKQYVRKHKSSQRYTNQFSIVTEEDLKAFVEHPDYVDGMDISDDFIHEVIIKGEFTPNLAKYNKIMKEMKNYTKLPIKKKQTGMQSLQKLALKKVKLTNELPEILYKKVVKRNFKRVMNEL